MGNLHPDCGPPPVSYYRHVADQMKLEPVIMGQLGDNPYSEAIRKAFSGCRFLPHVSPLIDFETIRQAVNIVTSVSTFSWMAAWLSNTAEVICLPVKGIFHPSQRPDVDLLPIGDARYQFYLFPAEKWNATEAQLKALTNNIKNFAWRSHDDVAKMVQYVP